MSFNRILGFCFLLSYLLSPVYGADADLVAPTTDFSKAERFENNPGGGTSHDKINNSSAFSFHSQNMPFERQLDFQIGDSIFSRLWVTAPSSTKSNDGLGPLFNARACQQCHIKDGRGHPPESNDDDRVSMLFRLSVPPQSIQQKERLESGQNNNISHPVYGGQLQDVAVPGIDAEGRMRIDYKEIEIVLADGEKISLRQPSYSLENLAYGDVGSSIEVSPRVAPQMIGLGLLEAISEQDILSNEDIEDRNGDGISGKANRVWSLENQKVMLGRFGLKAGVATLNEQNQAAFNGDIGLSTPLFKNPFGDCTQGQARCLSLPHGADEGEYEINADLLAKLLHYTRNLSVPKRRDVSAKDVLAGKRIFYQIGCISCHTPKFITAKNAQEIEQSRQLIWPYTDLLLHDMGEGLADNRSEGLANGREWRTPPLWGIGLTTNVNGHTYFLHDGRARSILEAILWHGGEAASAQQQVVALSKKERLQLLEFVRSL